jgi:hypothetical protein
VGVFVCEEKENNGLVCLAFCPLARASSDEAATTGTTTYFLISDVSTATCNGEKSTVRLLAVVVFEVGRITKAEVVVVVNTLKNAIRETTRCISSRSLIMMPINTVNEGMVVAGASGKQLCIRFF